MYINDEWCQKGGWEGKSNECFKDNNKVIFLLLEMKNNNDIIKLKKDVRHIFNRENHSCHCSDNYNDTMRMGEIFLNNNTLNYINYIDPSFDFLNNSIIKEFYDEVSKLSDKEKEGICVTGSAVMTAYNLRDCRDLDIFVDNDIVSTGFDNHNGYAMLNKDTNKNTHYKYHYLEIIHNPNYHFYINGIKFCNLDIIKDMKNYRYLQNSDKKDRDDYLKIINMI